MDTETRRLLRMVMSALSSGIIAAGGVILGAVSSSQSSALLTEEGGLNVVTWITAGVTGVVAVFKDIQSGLSSPPLPRAAPPPAPPVGEAGGQPVR